MNETVIGTDFTRVPSLENVLLKVRSKTGATGDEVRLETVDEDGNAYEFEVLTQDDDMGAGNSAVEVLPSAPHELRKVEVQGDWDVRVEA